MKKPEEMRGQLWNVKQVARYLNLSQRAVYSLVSQRLIPFVKILNRYRFHPEEVRDYTLRLQVLPDEGASSTSATGTHGG